MASVFTRIIRRELPAEIILETAGEIALLDHFPSTPGHTLVVPKREVQHFDELPTDEMQALMLAVHAVARGVVRGLATPHYNLILNNGAPAGQVIPHVHVHIMPRWPGQPRERRPLPPEQARETGRLLRQALRELGVAGVPAEPGV
ncbi:MAG TPA: HIT family protein [bacterium]|nr:HIT family protein [bacterium]